MLAIQPGRIDRANEELRSVGIGTGIRHGKNSLAFMSQLKVFVFKAGAIDRLASRACSYLRNGCSQRSKHP